MRWVWSVVVVGLLVQPSRPEEDGWIREIEELVRALDTPIARDRERATEGIDSIVGAVGQKALEHLESVDSPGVKHHVREIVRRHGLSSVEWSTVQWSTFPPGISTRPASLVMGDHYLVAAGEAGLHVLDARTGRSLWHKPGCSRRRIPGIVSSVVYAMLPPDSVAAYRAKTGDLLWAHDLSDLGGDSGREQEVWRVTGPGSSERERVPIPPQRLTDAFIHCVLVPEARRLLCSTRGGYVACLSPAGERLWTVHPPDGEAGPALAAFDATTRRVLVTYERADTVVALSLATGERVWASKVDRLQVPLPLVKGGRVVVASGPRRKGKLDGRIECLDVGTGERLWVCRLAPHVPSAPDAGRSRVRATTTEDRLSTVETGFIHRPGSETTVRNMVSVREGAWIVAETMAALLCVRGADGEVMWWTLLEGDAVLPRVSARPDGRVFECGEGKLFVLDPSTGETKRTIDMAQLVGPAQLPTVVVRGTGVRSLGMLGAPVAAGKRCFLSTEAGGIVCVRIPSLVAASERGRR